MPESTPGVLNATPAPTEYLSVSVHRLSYFASSCIDITYRLEHYVITDHVFLCYTNKIGESKNQASF